ncbi:DivIVA domain-containing protein [Dyadobacter psychrophilus]|uniref:Cell division initiation protein n=1 Tax=Dyadobacter psychrophilus TaxID=651661 RepID=A0A1T5FYY4_9BACT|nr:DivIVA domain-containing protein [Dyadobacter psychrophilus]SKC01386.1 cell division initiation protein [Dyadobacter psychrophilus]
MKISAIDIRKHTFEKIFRGYDPDEVDAFLNSLSQEWERFSSENSLLKMQLEYAEKELAKLKDIESTLFRTLKAAEDTSKLIEKEANENAEKRIEESRTTANDLVTEAENRTNQVIRETEDRLKRFKEDFAAEVKLQERDFRAIENFRDNLIVQLSSLANNTIETVERFEQKYDKQSVLNKMEEIKQHIAEIEIPKKAVFPVEPRIVPQLEEASEPDAEVILQDEKPEVLFEVVDAEEEVVMDDEEEFVPQVTFEDEEPELVSEVTVEAEPEPEPIEEPELFEEEIEYSVKEEPKSAAEESAAALAELQRTERARETEQAVNRPRVQENAPVNRPRVPENQPKKTGGGSFFDQI